MKKTLITATLALLSTQVMANTSPEVVVLSLKTQVGDQIVAKTELYSNQVDPNTSSVDDTFRLVVNGKTVDAPQDFLASLTRNRRAFSYDSMTDGVEHVKSPAMCMLGGEAQGYILETRYLDYKDSQIVGHEMKPVYAESANCLFNEQYVPNDRNAELSSAKSLATLKTLSMIYSQNSK